MGIILGKFRKKKSTLEILENVDKEIKHIEDFRRDTEQAQKRIVGRFIVISVGAYLLTAFIFYFHFFPADFYDQLFYIIPLIFAPVIIITVKRGLTWYYKRKISQKQNKLLTLREEKKKLLDQVKETETYKVAKTILDKYATENQASRKSIGGFLTSENNRTPRLNTPIPPDAVLRQRAPLVPLTGPVQSTFVTPYRPVMQSTQLQIKGASHQPVGIVETPLPLPRGILPKNRSVLDKMVDYLMGDGPTNRYALICKNCFGHNGMAHKDEFEYVTFRCCYCFTMNVARKKRPDGPKLELGAKMAFSPPRSETSDSEKNSPSESESEIEHESPKKEEEEEAPLAESMQQEPMEVEEEIESATQTINEIVNEEIPAITLQTDTEESLESSSIHLKD